MNSNVHVELPGVECPDHYQVLSRIGVSDTLYADRIGNIVHNNLKTKNISGLKDSSAIPVFDDEGNAYTVIEPAPEEGEGSLFYRMNQSLIEEAKNRASKATDFIQFGIR